MKLKAIWAMIAAYRFLVFTTTNPSRIPMIIGIKAGYNFPYDIWAKPNKIAVAKIAMFGPEKDSIFSRRKPLKKISSPTD